MGCMMPWARMDSANSFNAPSSMRVRGWYLPARIFETGRVDGGPSDFAGVLPKVSMAGPSAPSSASSPRPRPLGFLVAMSINPFYYFRYWCWRPAGRAIRCRPRLHPSCASWNDTPANAAVDVWITPAWRQGSHGVASVHAFDALYHLGAKSDVSLRAS